MNAITIASSGAKCLLENNYVTAGAELAMLFLDFINEFSTDKSITEFDNPVIVRSQSCMNPIKINLLVVLYSDPGDR